MAAHFETEALFATIGYRFFVSFNWVTTVVEAIVLEIEVIAKRRERRIDPILIINGRRGVVEMTLMTTAGRGRYTIE